MTRDISLSPLLVPTSVNAKAHTLHLSMVSSPEDGTRESLLKLLEEERSKHSNYDNKNFIPYNAARAIVTKDRVCDWSKEHHLCQAHKLECPDKAGIIDEILKKNVFLFVVLVFAQLEFLIEKLMKSKSDDRMLFDSRLFDEVCKSAGLSDEEKEKIVHHRSSVGVAFSDRVIQHVPLHCTLPFLSRERKDSGSSGSIFRIEIPAQHLPTYPNENVRYSFDRLMQDALISFRLRLLKNTFGQIVVLAPGVGGSYLTRLRHFNSGETMPTSLLSWLHTFYPLKNLGFASKRCTCCFPGLISTWQTG